MLFIFSLYLFLSLSLVSLSLSLCVYVCVYVCTHIYIYIHTHIYTYTNIFSLCATHIKRIHYMLNTPCSSCTSLTTELWPMTHCNRMRASASRIVWSSWVRLLHMPIEKKIGPVRRLHMPVEVLKSQCPGIFTIWSHSMLRNSVHSVLAVLVVLLVLLCIGVLFALLVLLCDYVFSSTNYYSST